MASTTSVLSRRFRVITRERWRVISIPSSSHTWMEFALAGIPFMAPVPAEPTLAMARAWGDSSDSRMPTAIGLRQMLPVHTKRMLNGRRDGFIYKSLGCLLGRVKKRRGVPYALAQYTSGSSGQIDEGGWLARHGRSSIQQERHRLVRER